MTKQLKTRINLKLLKYNLSNLKAYLILFSILLFSVGPFPVIMSMVRDDNVQNFYFADGGAKPYVLIAFATLLFIITPFIVFTYLNSKKSVDVYHSLPIKRNDLFATQVLTSFLITYIPFILNYFLTNFVYSISNIPYSNDYFIFLGFYTVLFFAVQLVSTFVIHNTGTLSDSLIHTGIMIALPFVIVGAFNLFVQTYVFGLKGISWDVLNYLTPFYPLFNSFVPSYKFDISLMLYWVLLSIILFLTIMHMYRLRKSEKSEEPFVNDSYFPIVINLFIPLSFILVNVLNSSYGNMNTISDFFSLESFVTPVLLSFVGYSILNILRYRSTKFFLKSGFDFIKVIILTTVVCVVLITTSMFGLAWKVPNADNVQSISFKPNEINSISPVLVPGKSPYDKFNVEVELVQEEAIEAFIAIHKEINTNIKKNGSNESQLLTDSIIKKKLTCDVSQSTKFDFTYNMKDGNKIEKTFYLPTEVLLSFGKLVEEDNYQIVMNPILNEDVRTVDLALYNNIKSKNLLLNNDPIFVEKFRDAYFNDLKKLSYNDLLFKESKLKYILEYRVDIRSFKHNTQGVNFNKAYDYEEGIINQIYLDDRFSQTVALLDTYTLVGDTHLNYFLIDSNQEYYGNSPMCGYILNEQYFEMGDIITDIDSYSDRVQGSHLADKPGEAILIENISLPLSP